MAKDERAPYESLEDVCITCCDLAKGCNCNKCGVQKLKDILKVKGEK